jgi:cell division protein ZapA (FtsZ GTPase activity inhibitor)
MAEPRIVQVEVHGHIYPIRTTLDAAYVHDLAAFVEQRMSLAAASSPSSDAVGLAVLAALNITDEYFRARDAAARDDGELASRAEAIERIVDQALALAE